MATDSLEEFSSFVNQQMLSIEDLNAHLSKASALMEVALRHDFSDFSKKTIHNYLWALHDVIRCAYKCSAHSLKDVFVACGTVNAAMASQSNSQETNA